MPVDNQDRIAWAGMAVGAYWSATRSTTGDPYLEVLGDLLGDLRHWALANGVDFDVANAHGAAHFAAECAEEDS